MKNKIKIKGARVHNLKNINVDIPKNKLVVFTGVSGSGKSSLAFDTIYAEGQRRYVESLSTYARQFLGIMKKPEVDLIEGLSPAISIDQKTTSRNPRSTVGTVTEVYDYLRLLFARVGHPHCPVCGKEITGQSLDQIVEKVLSQIKAIVKTKRIGRFMVLSPLVRDKKGEFTALFDNLKAKGFKQVRVDNYVKDLDEDFVLIKTNKHTIDAVIDKISISQKELRNKIAFSNFKIRITQSLEQALKLSEGNVVVSEILDKALEMPRTPKSFKDQLYSERFACAKDNIQLPEIEPRTFSFNSPHGACPTCTGLGKVLKVNEKIIFAEEISITEGAILPFSTMFERNTWFSRIILTMCEQNKINPRIPVKKLSKPQRDLILYGTGDKLYKVEGINKYGKQTFYYTKFRGIVPELERRYRETKSDYVRAMIEKHMMESICETCRGARLKKESLNITVDKLSISDVTKFSVDDCLEWISSLTKSNTLADREKLVGNPIKKEIKGRLEFLQSVGLTYLTLERPAGTLSGGEAQRIRLASQIGSGLTGVLYVLDEPTIGLHLRDNKKLINTLKVLRDLGNTVIVVEHDIEMMKQADCLIDFGPMAGKSGGEIVATGTPKQIEKVKNSLTGKYLSGRKKIRIAEVKNGELEIGKKRQSKEIKITGCSQFNLKKISPTFKLGKLNVITGVSGSGKSTLLVETLFPALKQKLNPFYRGEVGKFSRLDGVDEINKVILIDQSPIGRTPRSNPATYTKVFDPIRDVFAEIREARAAGYKKGRFSFNVKGGRCEACEGQGQNRIEMQFMADLWVTCEVCKGTRYNESTLDVNYKGKNVAEVLTLTVTEALEFFQAHPRIVRILETLEAVGLGYMELGQSATTLSGGEAQRVKLASELAKRATGDTIYILDEPTTGLHFADLERLLMVLKVLVAKGNTVLLIEHNMDVIKNADWIVDLGPEGGDQGGHIVAQGEIERVKKCKASYTGRYL